MKRNRTALSRSAEDYAEAVYELGREGRAVRVSDIAARLKVSKPSVTVALRKLAEQGILRHDPYGAITLTPSGAAAAGKVARTHETLARFLVDVLGVDGVRAGETACAMEHAVPLDVLRRIRRLAAGVAKCPCGHACLEGVVK